MHLLGKGGEYEKPGWCCAAKPDWLVLSGRKLWMMVPTEWQWQLAKVAGTGDAEGGKAAQADRSRMVVVRSRAVGESEG